MPNYCLDTPIRLGVEGEVRQVSVYHIPCHDSLVSLAMAAKAGPGSRCPRCRLTARKWFHAHLEARMFSGDIGTIGGFRF
jgi:hypothetical protein